MENSKPYTKAPRPDIGRGCAFYYTPDGYPEATPCGGCFKLHETAWLEEYPDHEPTDIFEVRFKNTRRSYYQNVNNLPLKRGDIVAVEASPGHDIGIVSLTGDMVARQMRRVGFNPYNGEFKKIYRKAKPYDIERWQEAIALEHETMIAARQIAAEMGLNMKIGDVEYQGDKIKAIFYYIADERVDFRELIKVFAERFHIRIEMKQIGARQEAGRIGGIGACGRELCCASWISSFSSVTTNSARVQELSLNPQKLAGQCSKLKCCLAYEYDVYAEARREFPRLREPLQALDGDYYLIKNDILAGTMSFSSSRDAMSNVVTLPVARVKEIIALNRAGQKVETLQAEDLHAEQVEEPTYRSEEDSITRFDNASRRRGRNRRKGGGKEQREKRTTEGAPRAEAAAKPSQERTGQSESGNGSAEGRGARRDRRGCRGEGAAPTERRGDSRDGRARSGKPRSESRPQTDAPKTQPAAAAAEPRADEGEGGAQRRSRSRGRNRRDGGRPRGERTERSAGGENPKKEE
ncbi:MAG: hypothetical protein K2H81_03745 [Alistipes sp.]|nr:hypothetical protein [Alistipes sp.]